MQPCFRDRVPVDSSWQSSDDKMWLTLLVWLPISGLWFLLNLLGGGLMSEKRCDVGQPSRALSQASNRKA